VGPDIVEALSKPGHTQAGLQLSHPRSRPSATLGVEEASRFKKQQLSGCVEEVV
jgi:hypothetical protein